MLKLVFSKCDYNSRAPSFTNEVEVFNDLNDEHKQDLGDSEVRTNVMVLSKKILLNKK